MAKKKRIDLQAYSSAADFPSIQSELVDASDRAAAIVGAAALDVHLERLLSAFMVDDMQEVNNLVASNNPGAPLGSFSARIRACYCLGLITKTAFDDLNRIRQIRNIFAHDVLECSFAQPAVQQICASLSLINQMIEVGSGSPAWNSRTRFVMAIYMFETLLRSAVENTHNRSHPPEIVINGPGHTRVEHGAP